MVKKTVLWLPVIATMVTIFCFSAQSGSESQGLSDSLLNKILLFFNIEVSYSTLEFLHVGIRKLAHFSIYAFLGLNIYLLMREGYFITGWKSVVGAPLISGAYAVTDEIHQLVVPGRSGMAMDVLIDFAGALCGMAVGWIIVRFIVGSCKNG